MSKKLFSEFLLEKGLVSLDDLLSSIMIQLKESKTVLDVVYQNDLLSKEEIFKHIKIQHKESCDFRAALKKSGALTERLDQEIKNKVFSSKKMLGDILVEKGVIDYKVLSEHLDLFLSEQTQESDTETDSAMETDHPEEPLDLSADASESESSKEQVVSEDQDQEESGSGLAVPSGTNQSDARMQPVIVSEDGLNDLISGGLPLDPGLVEKMISLFDPDKVIEVRDYTSSESMERVDQIICEWIAASRFVGASLTVNLLKFCRNMMMSGKDVQERIETAIGLVMDLVEVIRSELSEKPMWEQEEFRQKYLELIKYSG
ncbi:MAG: hypothetical protein H6618_10405 [Deltaproteobacteria bacterium]|nr:hypothetical protein [Deltaproteobacteria bacterium]